MVDNSQEYRLQYWATRSSVRSFARIAHSFACSGLLASLAPSAVLTRSLARSLRSLPRSWESKFLMSQNDLVLSHSASMEGAPVSHGRGGRRGGRRGGETSHTRTDHGMSKEGAEVKQRGKQQAMVYNDGCATEVRLLVIIGNRCRR